MRNFLLLVPFLAVLFLICPAIAQQKTAYQVPDSYNFDEDVIQQVTGSSGPTTLHYYYTEKGDYSALQADSKKGALMIFTKDGNMIIVDDQKKTITILRIKGLMGDLSKMASQYNKSNPSADSPKHDSSDFKFAKTGNTKQISGYTSEEYSFTDSKGAKGSVWYAKVDFNASLFLMMGAGASMPGAGMGNHGASSLSYPQLSGPNLLMTETESSSHPAESLTTLSISKKSLVISTKGYKINDISSMMGN